MGIAPPSFPLPELHSVVFPPEKGSPWGPATSPPYWRKPMSTGLSQNDTNSRWDSGPSNIVGYPETVIIWGASSRRKACLELSRKSGFDKLLHTADSMHHAARVPGFMWCLKFRKIKARADLKTVWILNIFFNPSIDWPVRVEAFRLKLV